MLVLVSFVLVLAAAVTLVVGLLQSGLTLIYLSIGCSVLAGVVLAVAVLRGRPEPKAASTGRSFAPPPQPAQVPASVAASSSGAETTTSWNAGPSPTPAPPPPPPTPYTPPAAGSGDDVATKAAGAALLGRLRGKRGDKAADAEPGPLEMEPAAGFAPADATIQMPAMATSAEDADGFPIAGYDDLRATELLGQLPGLDRNQLEAVRDREASGKNRFTIMSRVDALLATAEAPAWEVDDDEWDADNGAEGEPEVLVAEAGAAGGFDDDFDDEDPDEDEAPMAGGGPFPIASYETLTVGQILPRLSELDADELAQVRTREQMGRSRGTILDRIDRLASRRAPTGLAMPAAPAPSPAPAPARRTPARKAPAVAKTTAPAVKRAAKAPARRSAASVAPIAVPPAKVVAPRKAATKKAPAPVVAPAPRKARSPKAVAPVVPATPMKEAVKKARAARAKKA
ncbi:MAG: hypothetical protein M3066_21525 [Actinomycetota bacterium]|nr:hypothetical protein [Actinomycetota bacterium]